MFPYKSSKFDLDHDVLIQVKDLLGVIVVKQGLHLASNLQKLTDVLQQSRFCLAVSDALSNSNNVKLL